MALVQTASIEEELKRLQPDIAAHPTLGKLSPDELSKTYRAARDILNISPRQMKNENGTFSFDHAKRVRDGSVTLPDLEFAHQQLSHPKTEVPVRASMVAEMKARAASTTESASEVVKKTEHNLWNNASKESKVFAGMCFISAACGAIATFNAASKCFGDNESGEKQLQWSQVGWALVNAALTAGSAYIGIETLRSGAAR